MDHSALRFNDGDISDKYNPRGIIISTPDVHLPSYKDTSFFTIGLNLRCRQTARNHLCTILSLSKDLKEFLVLEQWNDIFQIRTLIKNHEPAEYVQIGVAGAFPKDSLQSFEIAFTEKGTRVYINGNPAGFFPYFYLTCVSPGDSFQIILGNSPSGKNPWNGEISSLVFYQNRDTHMPGSDSRPNKTSYPALSGRLLYLFDFQWITGSKVMEKVHGKLFFRIPEYFTILKKYYLTWRWNERRWNYVLFTDIFLNIIGFMPLGFFVIFYLMQIRSPGILFAVIAGTVFCFCVSLIIEVMQAFLVSRDSSAFDLILNTLGGAAGSFITAVWCANRNKKRLQPQ